MDLKDYESHPELMHYVKVIPAGEYLFKQGQLGRTMFILLDGVVELIAERDGSEHIESLLEAGQFLGEKAMMRDTPHQRLFGARARTATTVMELGLRDVEQIQRAAPAVMTDILKRAFQIAADRLAKANYMIRALRSSDNFERLIRCISYYCRQSGKRAANGIEVELKVDSIFYYIDMEKSEITHCLDELVEQGLLLRVSDDVYQVPDEGALLSYTDRFRGRSEAA